MKTNIFKKIGYYLSFPFVGLATLFNVASVKRLARKYLKKPNEVFLEERLKKVYKVFRKYLYFKKIKYAVEGLDNIHMRQQLFIANHKSTTDPMLIFCALYDAGKLGEVTIVAKKELEQSKTVKAAMTLLDGIFIQRDDGRSIWECYQKQLELIKKGRSVIVFPEGTRVEGDVFKQFQPATLHVAYDNLIPISPIAIFGTDKDYAKKNKLFKVVASVSFLKPLQPNNYMNIKREQLMATIQEDVFEKYNQLKAKPLQIQKEK